MILQKVTILVSCSCNADCLGTEYNWGELASCDESMTVYITKM